MKKAAILFMVLMLMTAFSAASAVEPEQCFDWNGRVLRVVDVLDGDAVTPMGDDVPEGRFVQLVISCEGEPLTWGLQRTINAILQDETGAEYRAYQIHGSFVDGVSFDINNMDVVEMKPEFTLRFDIPQEIAPADCTLSFESDSEETEAAVSDDAAVTQPVEPETESEETSADESPVDEVLDALGEDVYRTTYDALLSGEIIQSGSKGDAAKGVQQTLVAFGQNIAVDGNVGRKTIAALNAVQAAFGLDGTESLDAAGYADLLPRLLIATDPDAADDLLLGQMDGDEYDYMRACAMVAEGKYASAKALFEESGWNDWEARADACVQKWPKTGQLYKNSAVKGSGTKLTVKFNSDPDVAMLVKVYTTDGTLARTMFIAGNSKASTSLPAGTYIIKDGTGRNWYGEEESFGNEGSYEIMTFGDGDQEVQLKKNYASTITVNVKETDPNADFVGSDWEDWSDF